MANYSIQTNFRLKDTLASGHPEKVISSTDIDGEFDAISTALTSKANADAIESVSGPVTMGSATATTYTQSTYNTTCGSLSVTGGGLVKNTAANAVTKQLAWNYVGGFELTTTTSTTGSAEIDLGTGSSFSVNSGSLIMMIYHISWFTSTLNSTMGTVWFRTKNNAGTAVLESGVFGFIAPGPPDGGTTFHRANGVKFSAVTTSGTIVPTLHMRDTRDTVGTLGAYGTSSNRVTGIWFFELRGSFLQES